MSSPDADLTLLLSKALSFAIIAGSVIMQAPQIYKIVSARSAAGLTPLGWMSSVVAMTLTVSYNYRKGYPFSTYGELIFIMVQLDILILLVVHFNDGGVAWKGPLGVAAHAALLAACLSGVVPDQALVTMPMGLSCLSGTPQLVKNFRSGNTGQLATLPVFFAVAGLSIRLFTTFAEVPDPMVLLSQAIPWVLNSLLLAQLLVLPGAGAAAAKKSD